MHTSQSGGGPLGMPHGMSTGSIAGASTTAAALDLAGGMHKTVSDNSMLSYLDQHDK